MGQAVFEGFTNETSTNETYLGTSSGALAPRMEGTHPRDS